MDYLLGVDLGTSGTKTVLFDTEGREVASQSVEYPLYQPQNGWAEQDPRDWWNAAVSTIRGVLEKSGVNPGDVKGLGISGQMHGLVLLDENGEPLGRSLLWCDGRTQRECDEITQAVGAKRLIEIAANPALTGFTAGKILWVRRHQPELFARARHRPVCPSASRQRWKQRPHCALICASPPRNVRAHRARPRGCRPFAALCAAAARPCPRRPGRAAAGRACCLL